MVLIASFMLLVGVFSDEYSDYAFILSFLIAAAFSWFFGKKWNTSVVGVDEVTGQQVTYKPNHSIFWIPMQYWGIIFGVIAIVILVQQFI